jgi:hypothetical protein
VARCALGLIHAQTTRCVSAISSARPVCVYADSPARVYLLTVLLAAGAPAEVVPASLNDNTTHTKRALV